MPKHKRDKDVDDYGYLLKKIKRLEKKLDGNRRNLRDSSCLSPAAVPTEAITTDTEIIDAWAMSDDDDVDAPSQEQDVVMNHTERSSSSSTPTEASPRTRARSPAHAQPPAPAQPPTPVPPPPPAPVPPPPASAPPPAAAPPTIEVQAAPIATNTVDAPIPETEVALDADLLEILGIDPTNEKKYGKEIQKALSIRLEHCATNGLTKDMRKEFKEKYLTPENCKLIDPPEINAEIKAAVSEIVYKRDKAIESKQKQLTSSISCLSEAITLLMAKKEKDTALLKLLIDSARIICDCQHADTVTRRNFLLNAVKKEMKEQLQNTKIDKFLFSENLADTLKSAKAINKSGSDLKIPAPKAPPKKPVSNTPKNLNWKPGPARRPPGPPQTKEPAMTSTHNRPTSTSRPSQHRQRGSSHRRR